MIGNRDQNRDRLCAPERGISFPAPVTLLWCWVAIALAISQLAVVRPAWSAESPSGGTASVNLNQLNLNTSDQLGVVYLHQPADVSREGQRQRGWMLYGTSLKLGLGKDSKSTWVSNVYFGQEGLGRFDSSGLMPSLGPARALSPVATRAGGEFSLPLTSRSQESSPQRLIHQKLTYRMGKMGLSASYQDIGSQFLFSALSKVNGNPLQGLQPAQLQKERGTRKVEFGLDWADSGRISARSNFQRASYFRPGDSKQGLTRTNWSSNLAFNLGPKSKLTASYGSLIDQWDATNSYIRQHTVTRGLQLDQALGKQGKLTVGRMLTTKNDNGQQSNSDLTSLKLSLPVSKKLGLTSDYSLRQGDDGSWRRKSKVQLNANLGSRTKLVGAYLTNHSNEERQNTTQLQLSSSLGSKSTPLKLTGDYKINDCNPAPKADQWKVKLDFSRPAAKLGFQAEMSSKPYCENPAESDTTTSFKLAGKNNPQLQWMVDYKLAHQGTPQETRETDFSVARQLNQRTKLTTSYRQAQSKSGDGFTTTAISLQLKPSRPLAKWAQAASDQGLFSDSKEYGFRARPKWAKKTPAGLDLTYQICSQQNGEKIISEVLSYERMLGKQAYLRLIFQENPPKRHDNIERHRCRMLEVGGKLNDKLMLLTRLGLEESTVADETAQETAQRTLSRMFSLRGQLSAREQLEANVLFDHISGAGTDSSTITYGVQYSRQVSEDHFLTLKASMTDNQSLGVSSGDRQTYRMDLGYKKSF